MNAQRFQGKIAVVTGGNSGIGLGVAKAYAQEGAHVAITGRNAKTLEAAAKEIGDGTLAIQSDAAKVAEIEATTEKIKERFGRIDALFVNAGVAKLVPFEQVTEELFDETVGHQFERSLFYGPESDPAHVQRLGHYPQRVD
jgi:NAD(P)-dependent dehydrogenase (short-subunit alcohol dehydrogenase family)